jgi:hypothetical protein
MTKKKPSSDSVRETVERALDALEEDPRRFRELLKKTADLCRDVADGLAEADQPGPSGAVRALSRTLRGAALLPVSVAGALIRKALNSVLAAR